MIHVIASENPGKQLSVCACVAVLSLPVSPSLVALSLSCIMHRTVPARDDVREHEIVVADCLHVKREIAFTISIAFAVRDS